jgi:hypothetical protein
MGTRWGLPAVSREDGSPPSAISLPSCRSPGSLEGVRIWKFRHFRSWPAKRFHGVLLFMVRYYV